MIKTLWWRKIPVPSYGEHGGNYQEYTGPVDKMDELFKTHDSDLDKAKTMVERKEADKKLGRGLRKNLKPYKHKIYGPVYHFFSKLIFKG